MLCKPVRVQRSRSDDEFQIGAARQQALQITEQEIDIERALVRLVDDDRVVMFEQRIALDLGQQDAVGHQLDGRIGRHFVVEAHLVADQSAQFRFQFLRDARCHRARRHPARLGVADDALYAAPKGETNLRQLRGLAGAGLAAHDHHLMLFDRLRQFLAAGDDRQISRIFDGLRRRDAGQPALGERG